jgi:hypothetical protein
MCAVVIGEAERVEQRVGSAEVQPKDYPFPKKNFFFYFFRLFGSHSDLAIVCRRLQSNITKHDLVACSTKLTPTETMIRSTSLVLHMP